LYGDTTLYTLLHIVTVSEWRERLQNFTLAKKGHIRLDVMMLS